MTSLPFDRRAPSAAELALVLVLVSLLTGSELPEIYPGAAFILRILSYGVVLAITVRQIVIHRARAARPGSSFADRYRHTLLWPTVLYLAGLSIGSLNGPTPLESLWQTASDAIVFGFAFAAFGWLQSDLNSLVRRWLRITAIWSGGLAAASVTLYLGNLAGVWLVNPFYWKTGALLMNGPFNHANHLGYVLMSGSLAAGSLAVAQREGNSWRWWLTAILLAVVQLPTFARGAMIGTAAGLLALLSTRNRRLAGILAASTLALVLALTAATALNIPLPEFIPKQTFSGRGLLWSSALQNLMDYGPLGVGPGNAESLPNWTPHNFWLEQYGEGGILTLAGVLGWLILPILVLRHSALDQRLALAVVSMMGGLMIHGLFWGQFLIGLRYLSVVYVPLWVALATPSNPGHDPPTSSTHPAKAQGPLRD